jgi:hypothetical protein
MLELPNDFPYDCDKKSFVELPNNLTWFSLCSARRTNWRQIFNFDSFVSSNCENVIKIAIRFLLQDDWLMYKPKKLQLIREWCKVLKQCSVKS